MILLLEGCDCVGFFVVNPWDDLQLTLAGTTYLKVDRSQTPICYEGELVDCLIVTEG
jgi:hypothetical protein